ncbi:MAG: SirA family protein [Clostridiales bacterium]|nr:SirA family protein [Clostridiales bacterium]
MGIVVDARGLSCPEPLLLTQEALDRYPGQALMIQLNSPVARDRVTELLDKKGRVFDISRLEDSFLIQAREK